MADEKTPARKGPSVTAGPDVFLQQLVVEMAGAYVYHRGLYTITEEVARRLWEQARVIAEAGR